MEIAAELNTILDFDQRKNAFVKHVRADVNASTIWLDLVHQHMQSENDPPVTAEHLEYMSRFQVTKTCSGAHTHHSSSWIEWIEPLSIHARHPFALGRCGGVYEEYPGVALQSSDHVLVHSGKSIHEATALTRHNHTKFVAHRNHHTEHRGSHLQTRNYLFDAGTSTFDSSLFWFTCAYSQRGVSFDQVFGWEMTLLEPVDYWRRVPALWKPYWHFHNVPVQASAQDADSPLRYIQQLAGPGDFVAFKLDIDSPDMEMPIALALRDSAQLAGLVDEFFFELHFR